MIKLDKRFLQRLRVPLGFIFAAVFLFFAKPTLATILAGSAIAIVGLSVRAWASGHIRKAETLAISGPYAHTRNPLYLGSFLMGVGFTVASGVWWLALIFAILFLGIYFPVMRVESEDIRRVFGGDFDEYERHVPLFFPRITVWRRTGIRFDSGLYLRYREYRAAIGVAAAIGLLAAKAIFLN
jgi:protein-S-isoprenylcysteine O-methyltransferase Ste14